MSSRPSIDSPRTNHDPTQGRAQQFLAGEKQDACHGERVVNAKRFAGRVPEGDTSPSNVEADSQSLAYGRNKRWPRLVTDSVRAKEEDNLRRGDMTDVELPVA